MAIVRSTRFSSTRIALALVALAAGTLAGCGSDNTGPSEASPTEAATATQEVSVDTTINSATESEVSEAEAITDTTPRSDTTGVGQVAVDSLATDSATCMAFAKVKALNDRSGELTSEFTSKMLAGAGEGDSSKVAKAWEEFRVKFAADADLVLPELQAAYATLAAEQPQFADDFANLDEVTVKVIKMFASIGFNDLDKLEERLSEAVPQDKTIAAGQSSLKIDTYAKAACGIAFANT